MIGAAREAYGDRTERNSSDGIVMDIELPDGAAMNLCREAEALPKPGLRCS
jgi:DNA-binding response OmpR family regulator